MASAVLAILVSAAINVLRTAYSDLSAKVFTGLKLAGLAMIIGWGLRLDRQSIPNSRWFSPVFPLPRLL